MLFFNVCFLLSVCLVLLPGRALGQCLTFWTHHSSSNLCTYGIPPFVLEEDRGDYCVAVDSESVVHDIDGEDMCTLPYVCWTCGGTGGGGLPPGK